MVSGSKVSDCVRKVSDGVRQVSDGGEKNLPPHIYLFSIPRVMSADSAVLILTSPIMKYEKRHCEYRLKSF